MISNRAKQKKVLAIVESPGKVKKITKLLQDIFKSEIPVKNAYGADHYEVKVVASDGHICDLPEGDGKVLVKKWGCKVPKGWPKKILGVASNFEPVFECKKDVVASLQEEAKTADIVLLATDLDREGEAIAWHIQEKVEPVLKDTAKEVVHRLVFTAITYDAMKEALLDPQKVDQSRYIAFKARRVLDRLFGYGLSPVMWRKVLMGLSAGRVQSVALRLVVEREEERQRLKSTVFWGIRSDLEADGQQFQAELHSIDGTPIAISRDFDSITGEPAKPTKSRPQVKLLDEETAKAIVTAVGQALPWKVTGVVQKSVKQSPRPPFTTSTLLQAASGQLRSSPKKTMSTAQRLYEEVDLGGDEREGLITYMRTDDVTLSGDFMKVAAAHIVREFGEDYYKGPRQYKTKAKLAQEAHEAIRPTDVSRTPEKMARFLQNDELKLYRLIWQRAVASQMTDALIDRTTVGIVANVEGSEHAFRATGSVLRFPGYQKVSDKRDDQLLPDLAEGDLIASGDSQATDHKTKPQARYTEASLVKKLDEEGIGRPSTYVPTMSRIQDKNYVAKKGTALFPTVLGIFVMQLLRDHFPSYIELDYTEKMEDQLDKIAKMSVPDSKKEMREYLHDFYMGSEDIIGLAQWIEDKITSMEKPRWKVAMDLKSGKPVYVRAGKFGCYLQLGEDNDRSKHTASFPQDIDPANLRRDALLYLSLPKRLGYDQNSGKAVYLCYGKYGLYVQLGEQDDERKHSSTVPEDKNKNPKEIDLEYALYLLRCPILLGHHPDSSGEPVTVRVGKKGFFVQLGELGEKKKSKPTTVSLPENQDPLAVELEYALERLSFPKLLGYDGDDENSGKVVRLYDGKYGFYVQLGEKDDKQKRRSTVPEDKDIAEIDLDCALYLLRFPIPLGHHPDSDEPVTVRVGKKGFYVQLGEKKKSPKVSTVSLPKDEGPAEIDLSRAIELLNE